MDDARYVVPTTQKWLFTTMHRALEAAIFYLCGAILNHGIG